MMSALLREHLHAVGIDATVASAGTRATGAPVMAGAAALLARRGIDVLDHLGMPLNDTLVERADLIVTAEQVHVIDVAGQWPGTFDRTFTLPELVQRASALPARNGADPRQWLPPWLEQVNDGRPKGVDYVESRAVGEIDDPTGLGELAWETTHQHIDTLTRHLAHLLR